MGYYIFRKKELIEQLKNVGDDDFIMIKMGGHTAPSHPITHVEDSQSIGFWEIRCDANADFWEELEKANPSDEGIQRWVVDCFPELAESEDEKIMKAIYKALKYLETELSWDFLGDVDILDAYAWLINQAPKDSLKDNEQKPVEWSEEDENMRDNIITGLEMLRDTVNGESLVALYNKKIDWLKSLRPQKHPWVIVDKEIYVNEPVLAQLKDKSDAFSGYVVCNDHTLTPTKYERYVKISNIVKQHQSHWKPTKIQLEVLDRIIHFTHFDEMKGSDIFRGLYEQLKAL